MEWFYSLANERRGPVDGLALLTLLQNRSIDFQTLVWRDGLGDWVPLSKVHGELAAAHPGAAGAAPLTLASDSEARPCVECGNLFSPNDLVVIQGQKVCASCKPLYFQKVKEGLSSGSALWRRKRQLVMGLQASLPARCIKCNLPAEDKRLKRELYWHHPALYVMILVPGLLFYAIVALIVRKRLTLQVPVCQRHRSKRTRSLLIGWLLFLVGLGLIIFGASSLEETAQGAAVVTGAVMILASLVVGIINGRFVSAAKIDKENAFVAGMCPEFLAEFPEWSGP